MEGRQVISPHEAKPALAPMVNYAVYLEDCGLDTGEIVAPRALDVIPLLAEGYLSLTDCRSSLT